MVQRNRTVAKSEIPSLTLAERVQMEAAITDARITRHRPEKYRTLSLARHARESAWRRYALSFLGNMKGKIVMDICCGYAMTPVIFALSGAAHVVANDVAPATLDLVREVAEMHGVADRMSFYCGPTEDLPYRTGSIDLVFGGAALHHLQLDKAGAELARVMRRGGHGAFQDPLGHNTLLEFARDNLHYAGKHPVKGTDRPLKIADIEAFGSHFSEYHWRGFDMFAMLPRIVKPLRKYRRALESLDAGLLDTLPFLQRYARFAVTCVVK